MSQTLQSFFGVSQTLRRFLRVSQTLTSSHKKFFEGEPNSYFKPQEVFCGWAKLLLQAKRSLWRVSQPIQRFLRVSQTLNSSHKKFFAGEPNSYFNLQEDFCRWAKLFEVFSRWAKLLLQATSFLQVSQTLTLSHKKFLVGEPNSSKLFAGQRNSYFKPQEDFCRWAKLLL